MLVKKCIGAIGELVEGPMWCRGRNSLFFTDIVSGTVFEYIPKMEKIQHWKIGTFVGCIVPGNHPGEIIAAVDGSLKALCPETGAIRTLCPFPMPEGVRFNDGKCGPGGHLWVGTMEISGPREDAHGQENIHAREDANGQEDIHAREDAHMREDIRPKGGLYRVGPDGRADCAEPFLAIPNGMVWDVDKGIFYHVRTEERAVYAYRYHKDRHLIQRPVKAVDLSQEQGVPDGMAMDRDGNLWIAMWGGYKVICINPVSGAKLGEVVLPDANVSCCTFGGEHLDRLYITSARDGQGGGNVFEADAGAAGTDPYEFCWKEEEII